MSRSFLGWSSPIIRTKKRPARKDKGANKQQRDHHEFPALGSNTGSPSLHTFGSNTASPNVRGLLVAEGSLIVQSGDSGSSGSWKSFFSFTFVMVMVSPFLNREPNRISSLTWWVLRFTLSRLTAIGDLHRLNVLE